MAEKGAHLTQIQQIKPSIFDFVAQESLDALLHPAFKKVADVLAIRNPVLNFFSEWFNELFYISHFILQLHYLRKFGGTFSETFYGLKRVSVKSGSSHLTNREILVSLVFCSAIPYLRKKLNDIADKINFDVLPLERKRKKIAFLKSIITLNTNVNVSIQILTFIQYLKYLSGNSEYISPFLQASQLKLEYSTNENFSTEGLTIRNFLPQILRKSFELTAFFIQFCQWWQTEKLGNFGKLPIPEVPQVNKIGETFKGLCPICGGKRKSETVLNTSGFVFCFKCISDHVTTKRNCPITDLPASESNLIRLYPPN